MSVLNFPADAVWIGSAHAFDLNEAYLCFRSPAAWQLSAVPDQADLFITADSRYKLWINGQFVTRGPSRSFPHNQFVDQLDVTAYLREGTNTLAVQVYQPGYSHFAYVHRGAAGLLAHLVCDGETAFVSNLDWRFQRDHSFNPNVPRVSIYGTGVEERDMKLVTDWMAPEYDDSTWETPRLFAPVNGDPWTGMSLRAMPLMVEREIPMRLIETRQGAYPEAHWADAHLALREGWLAATASSGPSPDETGWITVNLAAEETAYWLFDLGRDYTCQGWAEVKGATGQEMLSIGYQEKIRDGALVISDPATYCRVRLTDRFQLRSGDQMVEGFTLRGGRYLIFQVSGPTETNFQFRPHVRVSEYPVDVTKPLQTSDPLLNNIITICETTFEACLQDGFVDSTWRESSQWIGDALPQSQIMAAMTDDARPLKQVIEMGAEGAYPDGVLPSVLPGEVHAYAVVDYNFTWVELLHLYYGLSGDNKLIGRMWPVLQKMLDRFHQDSNEAGLIISQPGRRLFLDWAPVSRNEPNAIYNFRYLSALQEAVMLAEACGRNTDGAAAWRERAEQLQTALRSTYWRDGRWYDDLEGNTFSQLSATFAVATGTATTEESPALLEAVIARSLDQGDDPAPDKMVLASPFMHNYILETLRQHQKLDEVIEIIRQRWGRWVEWGYPTTWENWSVDFPDGSQCHAFSAHPRYHLAEIAKVRSL